MKSIFVLAASLIAIPFAAAQATIPPCALNCALTAISSTGCGLQDAACICEASAFQTGVAACIQGACSAADIQATLDYAQQYCASAGVTLSSAASVATSAASAASSASSMASMSVSSVMASLISSMSSVSSQMRTMSAASEMSSMASVGSSSAAPATFTGAANKDSWNGELFAAAGFVMAAVL